MLKFNLTATNQTIKNLIIMCSKNYSIKFSEILFILFFVTCRINVAAQPGLTFYADAARNSVSDGLFLRSAILGYYKSGNYQFTAGIQTNLVNNNNVIFSGYRFNGSREFKIKSTLLQIQGFWLRTSASTILRESNYGCAFSMNRQHFNMLMGTNFRTYSFSRNAFNVFEIERSVNKIHENFNLMYSFSYNLKPSDNRWNAGVTLTNVDYFMINQETNPYVNLKGYYTLSSPVCLFAEGWYKNAGVTNISSNYFGFVIRGGVQWNFN